MCQYCNRSFASKFVLKTHINNAQYCINLRMDKQNTHVCQYCETGFEKNGPFLNHLKVCQKKTEYDIEQRRILTVAKIECKNFELKSHYEQLLSQKDQEIKELKAQVELLKVQVDKLTGNLEITTGKLMHQNGRIEELAKIKPTKISNNTTNVNSINNVKINQKLAKIPIDTIRPLTIELLRENLCNYTFDKYIGGKEALVKFFKTFMTLETKRGIERNYACTDMARNVFHKLITLDDSQNDSSGIISTTVNTIEPKESKVWSLDGQAEFILLAFDELKPLVSAYNKKLNDAACEYDGKSFDSDFYAGILKKNTSLYEGIIFSDERRSRLLASLMRKIGSYTAI